MSVALLLSPVVHSWYFFWSLPFLACALLPRRLLRTAVATTLVLGLLAPVEVTRHLLRLSRPIIFVGVSAVLLTVIDPRDLRRLKLLRVEPPLDAIAAARIPN